MFSFTGRLSRLGFAFQLVILGVFGAGATYGLAQLMDPLAPSTYQAILALQAGAWAVVALGAVAAAVRRLHDLQQTGWWALVLLAPGLNLVFALFLLVAPGVRNGRGTPQPGLWPDAQPPVRPAA